MFHIDIIVISDQGDPISTEVYDFPGQKAQIDCLAEIYRDYIGAEHSVPQISPDGIQVTLVYADRIAFIYPY